MHVEAAERGMRPLPCSSLPIRVDHPWNAKLIFRVVPAESHHHGWRLTTVNFRFIKTERSLHRAFRENDSGKICLLQKFNETTRNLGIMALNIKKDGAAVSNQHDIARFRIALEFGLCGETRSI